MQTIKIGEKEYRLEFFYGGESIVNEYLEQKGKNKTINDFLKEVMDYVKIAVSLNKIKDKEEKKQKSLELMTSIKKDAIMYLLWSVMINVQNWRELTYDRFFEIVFDINKYYKMHELINIILDIYVQAQTDNEAETENAGNQKKK